MSTPPQMLPLEETSFYAQSPASNHEQAEPPHSVLKAVAAASFLLFGVFGLVSIVARPENSDMSWLYYVADRVLHGARLGVDVVDPNPPPIVWLNVPVVLIGRLLRVSPDIVYRALVTMAGATTVIFCRTLYVRAVRNPPAVETHLAGLWLFFVVLVLPGANFGEREHVFVILILPYLFVAASRISGAEVRVGEAAAAGLLAGVGCSIKPFFPPVIIAMEAVRVARRRDWRRWLSVEGVVAFVTVAMAAAATVVFEPDYLWFMRSFGASVYAHFRPVPIGVILREPRFLIGLAGALAFWLSRPLPRHRPLGAGISLAAVVASVAVVVQQKGFAYHYLPAVEFSALLLPLSLVAPRVRLNRNRHTPLLVDTAAGAMLVLAVWGAGLRAYGGFRDRVGPQEKARAAVERCMERLARGKPVLVLSSDMGAAFPAVREAGVTWPLPFSSLWPLYAAHAEEFGWGTGTASFEWNPDRAEAYVAMGVARALRQFRPALILVDERALKTPIGPRRLDMLPILAAHPDVRRALNDYQSRTEVGGMRLFLPNSSADSGVPEQCGNDGS